MQFILGDLGVVDVAGMHVMWKPVDLARRHNVGFDHDVQANPTDVRLARI